MPAISINTGTSNPLTKVTLDGSTDTIAYPNSEVISNGRLYIDNASGGGVTITVKGDNVGATVDAQACGLGTVDTSGVYTLGTVADGDTASFDLYQVRAWLNYTTAVTVGGGAAGVEAWIVR